MYPGERAQSEVIGTVLLLGITIAAVTATVATGSVALGAVTDEAQAAGVENGMSQFTSQASLVALGETDAKRFDLGSVDGGDLRLEKDAGRVEVRIERPDGNVTNESYSLGALVYSGESREIAVQGGGVWSSDGTRGRMVSPPEYHYRGETLTFPIVRLTADSERHTSTRGTGVVRRTNASKEVFPNVSNPLENGTVVVEVRSDYYEGWYDFFSQRAEGDVTKDDANRTVTARLVVPEVVTFDRAITVQQFDGYSHKGKPQNELNVDEYREGVSTPSPNGLIENEIEAAEADNDNAAESCVTPTGFDGCGTVGSGVYHFPGDATVDDDFEFDTTGGDVVVAVDGDFDIGNSEMAIADNSSNGVTYYVNGSLDIQGSGTVGTDPDPTQADRNVFYVAGGFLDESAGEGSPTMEAIVYAPNADVVAKGKPTLRGAFVTNSLSTGGNARVEYDTNLGDLDIRITGGGGSSPITYLHVSENVVGLRFDE
ncbi:DUF7289 family protein [Halorubrum cibi]|uniref:Flagellin N-terminal-like domain-containing protein n=1 Tax=Halorubrum cibi TaxID=413815 RepID=A0A521EET9_9EURY|nr:archaellin/type IV pilin N-terminal domain-containing protein [Halorubrum cibi]SMO81680.1 flagellin N-terminal-like domain-containing protein [Halorubrum cibi]